MSGLLLSAITPKDIDRRQCKREVPMKVLVLGMSRTGTSSIRIALKDLGYDDVYHMASVWAENPSDAHMWNEAFDAKFEGKGTPYKKEQWDQLLGHCMGISDAPCLFFMEELCEAYPDAKIILSTRDSPEQWFKSFEQTLIPSSKIMLSTENTWWNRFYNFFLPTLPFQTLYENIAKAGQLKLCLNLTPQQGAAIYSFHNYKVRALARKQPGRLLEFNVKQGWEPLCEFLEKEVPRDEKGEVVPFPRVNDSKDFTELVVNPYQQFRNTLVAINVGLTLTGVVGAAAGGVLLAQRYGLIKHAFCVSKLWRRT